MLKNSRTLLTLAFCIFAVSTTKMVYDHLNPPAPETEYCGCKFWANFDHHPTVTTHQCHMVGPYLKVGDYYYKVSKWKPTKCKDQ